MKSLHCARIVLETVCTLSDSLAGDMKGADDDAVACSMSLPSMPACAVQGRALAGCELQARSQVLPELPVLLGM